MLSPEYLAGFFDGEGCVSLPFNGTKMRNHVRLLAVIVSTDSSIISLIQQQIGGYIYTKRRASSFHPNWKTGYSLRLDGQRAADFLSLISPHVRVKKAQVSLGLEFWQFTRRPKAERCAEHWGCSSRGRFHTWRIRPEIAEIEEALRNKLHQLNAKGRHNGPQLLERQKAV